MRTPIDSSVGSQIRLLRLQKGMKQLDLAKRLSVTSSTVSNWENGRRMPSIDELRKISSFFNVSLEVFGDPIIKTDAEKVHNIHSPTHQAITIRYFGMIASPFFYFMLMLAVISISISAVLIHVIRFYFAFWGLLSIASLALIFSFQFYRYARSLEKNISISLNKVLVYKQTLDSEKTKLYRNSLRLLATLSYFIYTALYMSLAYHGLTQELTIWLPLIGILSAVSLGLSYFRQTALYSLPIFDRQIRFTDLPNGFRLYSPPISVYLDILLLLILSYYIHAAANDEIKTIHIYLSIVLVSLSSLSSIGFLLLFRTYVSKFQLFLHGDNEDPIRLT